MGKRHDLSDTIFIFCNDEILINCYRKNNGWFVGDITDSNRIPEYCSIAKVSAETHKTESIDGIISGGYLFGQPSNQAYTFALNLQQVNAVDTINCSLLQWLPPMIIQRYMH